MSRFIDQIRKAKQARLEALQQGQEPDAEGDDQLAEEALQGDDQLAEEALQGAGQPEVAPRREAGGDSSEELFPDEDFETGAVEAADPSPGEQEDDPSGLPEMSLESDAPAGEDEWEFPAAAEEFEPDEESAVEMEPLAPAPEPPRDFAREDDESLFPSGMEQGVAASAETPAAPPDAPLPAPRRQARTADADTAPEASPQASAAPPRRSRKPLFPSQLEESRDQGAPQDEPGQGVPRRRASERHGVRGPAGASRRRDLQAPQWRPAGDQEERPQEQGPARGAGMSPRSAPVSGPPVDPDYVKRIPKISLRPDRRVLVYYDPKHHICEEYRLLGKNLLHTFANALPPSNKGRVVTLTSSVRGEGKTLTGVNLSLTLAEDLAHRVLLVDADLRHPKSHTYAGIPSTSGLNDMMTSQDPASVVENCIQRTETGLHVLMSSPVSGNPAPLLDSDHMTKVLDVLRERYALIIVDTPPVLLATDALTLGVKSDGMLFLFRARKTPREQIQEARQRIARLDIRLLGYVINNVRSFLPRIWSRYYYGNY